MYNCPRSNIPLAGFKKYFFLLLLPTFTFADERPVHFHPHQPRIQLAILLDTSNSMDGLIDQTRSQLWQMVDELSKAKKRGVTPLLQVAVLEYGNDSVAAEVGHIRQVTGLTSDLDRVSEALFSLRTNGGEEFCGYVIKTAVKNLQWSQHSEDLRLIYIAGNEPFTQGPVDYVKALNLAKSKGINVSAIFAGEHHEGVATGWQQGALLAGGNYMSIDHNQHIAYISAPQDQQIAKLNVQLNATYIPMGPSGKAAAARQQEQDRKNSEVSSSLLAQRVKSKVSNAYNNSNWDLVDALDKGEAKLDEIDEEKLPASMGKMDIEEKQKFVATKKEERERLKNEIAALAKARDQYVKEQEKKQAASSANTMKDVLADSIKEQAVKKEYHFE